MSKVGRNHGAVVRMGGIAELPERGIIRLDGEHRVDFLQGLVSNDVTKLAPDRPLYASLLTAQGKFLHDFLLFAQGDAILIECEAPRREDLLRRLRMYKLRSRIELRDESAAWRVFVAWDEPAPPTLPDGVLCHPDPRHAALGLRLLVPADQVAAALAAFPQPPESIAAYHRHRIALGVPDGSRDMVVEKAILLENGFDALNGVAWDKGCYIGQELTARTKYRGLIKKRLIPVAISGPAPEPGTPVTRDGAEVGEMRGAEGDLGLALLRLECLNPGAEPQSNLHCGAALLTPRPPTWLTLPQAQG